MSNSDTTDHVLDNVAEIVGARMGIDPTSIDPDAWLVNDLGLESLDMLTIMAQLENQFDVDIPEEVITKVYTMRDIARFLKTEFAIETPVDGGVLDRVGVPAAPAPATETAR